jgi:hypothetical protein
MEVMRIVQGLSLYFHLDNEMSRLARRRRIIVGMHQVRYTLFVIVARRKFIIRLSIGRNTIIRNVFERSKTCATSHIPFKGGLERRILKNHLK